jgi:hypothetical protein
MEKEQILLPDGEHLINGTIYVVKDGVVIEKKEVTAEQEEVIEEVAAATPEVMADVPVEEIVTPTAVVEEVAPVVEDDRLAKLEAAQESLMSEIAKLKSELEAPLLEELPVEMSDNRPMWRKISDSINTIKNQK